MSANKTVCHISTVHTRYDIRIFHKECKSLASGGYDVTLIVADGKGDEIFENVRIYDMGLSGASLLGRFIKRAYRAYKHANLIDADIYQFHDPELLPVGIALKMLGKKVVYDVHENVPFDILDKQWIHPWLRKPISICFDMVERFCSRFYDSICAATPSIGCRFDRLGRNVVTVNNFPFLDEFASASNDWSAKSNQICYVGDIATIRGIKEIVNAVEFISTGARIQLGGTFSEPEVEREVKKYSGWSNIDAFGWLDRDCVRDMLSSSVAGLVIFHPLSNHVEAQPNKMFEYMAAGIPVIASHFPLWRKIIEGNNCGICVDPLNPQEIAMAVNKLLADHELAATMGANGRKAVEEVYNWQNEERKLLDLYQVLS